MLYSQNPLPSPFIPYAILSFLLSHMHRVLGSEQTLKLNHSLLWLFCLLPLFFTAGPCPNLLAFIPITVLPPPTLKLLLPIGWQDHGHSSV